MNELAGSVGTVTAIGMGTVFVCLMLLYTMTRVLGAIMVRASAPKPAAPTAAPDQSSDEEAAESDQPAGPSRELIAAAIMLVLARHRAARAKPLDESGVDPWKLAGRVRALRGGGQF